MQSSRGETVTDPACIVDNLVAKLKDDPDDSGILDELVRAAEAWVQAAGLEPPTEAESIQRAGLAAWLAHLSGGGAVAHYGWRDGAVAASLASTGATVASYLDHPGRAMVSAIRHRSSTVHFGTLDQPELSHLRQADLVVVETTEINPVIALDEVRGGLRVGGWLAVLGGPVAPHLEGLVDAGCFCLDEDIVRPCAPGGASTQLALYRVVAPAQQVARREPKRTESLKTEPSPLELLIRSRDGQSDAEIALQRRASCVVETAVPDKELIDWVGGGTAQTFHNIGLINFHQLMLYCRLKPEHHVLEPGCGCGRNARPLAAYLDPRQGTYEGFDIHTGAIEWASAHITAVHPHVRFHYADIHNTNYNPGGTQSSAEFVFPHEPESFDVVFMPSVFTHMTRDELKHYAGEIERVLKPGGLLLSWHFLLDETSRRGIESGEAAIEFHDYDEVSMVMLRDNPCAAIAFDERWILELYEAVGLRTQAVIHGRWSGREPDGYTDYQDRILASKTHPRGRRFSGVHGG